MEDILKNRIAGAIYGVAIGDALGAPLEFMSVKEIEDEYGYVTEMIGGGWLNVTPGETTDDTAMMLAVAEGIIEESDDPISAIGERFIKWAGNRPKDIGGTCRCAIQKATEADSKRPSNLQWFRAAQETAVINEGRSGGNGALMRTVYPGIFYTNEEMAVETARAIARMTHWDGKSTDTCILYTRMLHLIIRAVRDCLTEDRLWCELERIFENTDYDIKFIRASGEEALQPTGYSVDSFICALYMFWEAESFEEAVIFAANLGGDADTIAAITGGIAGAFYGYAAIPDRWLSALSTRDKERLDKAADAAVKNWGKERGL